ncbi:hypothetical protein G7Z17_g7871 [Cylindrodendrum hubeiense]|uniref:Xylanolytic transcriptional activator regulatory domain-containing protein n=1 Tax=Cylindrodendrum hubeiense TaxID=595255 RepID=A0A9P5H873_9HYPO|nr:hypothetical protein G7Z17_g7871 [Cylindrodendrum hubeiense]
MSCLNAGLSTRPNYLRAALECRVGQKPAGFGNLYIGIITAFPHNLLPHNTLAFTPIHDNRLRGTRILLTRTPLKPIHGSSLQPLKQGTPNFPGFPATLGTGAGSEERDRMRPLSSHLAQVEARLRWLEDSLRRIAPEELENAPVVSAISLEPGGSSFSQTSQPLDPSLSAVDEQPVIDQLLEGVFESTCDSASPATSTQIKPSEPLAHEVGLLSLANSKESKYLGPSSGVPFARLIFSAIPQSQGLAACWATPNATDSNDATRAQPFPQDWTSEVDLQHFVDAYFEMYQPLYPFLDEDAIHERFETLFIKRLQPSHAAHMPRLAEIEAALSPVHSVQVFLIIALGARTLEPRLSSDFSSERYLATAMSRLDSLALHDSIEGLQIMLLLTLCSFSFVDGPNAWFLTSNIIASCLDLGFQRRWMEISSVMSPQQQQHVLIRKTLRSGIFWSAYSLERSLAVVLGRPLTLRDEAIDVEFPGNDDGIPGHPDIPLQETTRSVKDASPPSHKRTRLEVSPYTASHYSFRFDRIAAEIKLTLYRVVNMPDRFPWPTDLPTWQSTVHKNCDTLLDDLIRDLKWRSRRGTSDGAIRSLELKYHQCLMLLHRPSPAISEPSIESWKTCYESAVKTLLISAELHRFCKLTNSWLTAHNIFVSGITFLYCLWIKPNLMEETSIDTFNNHTSACSTLLKYLGKTWSVAADALEKFERLVQLTAKSWRSRYGEQRTEVEAGQSLISLHQSDGWYNMSANRDDDNADGIPNPININEPAPGSLFPTGQINENCELEFGSFYNELGDMSTWFDLDWIG